MSQLLADRNQDFTKLVQDGDKVLQAVQSRRAVIHQLLINTVALSQQVNALIRENESYSARCWTTWRRSAGFC